MHTRYRRLVNKGFTPRMVDSLEATIRERTRSILDKVGPRGECDFVVDVAAELPLQVIADILGVPQADRYKMFDWSNRMIGSEDPGVRRQRGGGAAGLDGALRLRGAAVRGEARPGPPRRRPHHGAERGGGRRRAAHPARDRPVLHAPDRRRERDDPQPHLARDGAAPRAPRPAGEGPGRPDAPRPARSTRCCAAPAR